MKCENFVKSKFSVHKNVLLKHNYGNLYILLMAPHSSKKIQNSHKLWGIHLHNLTSPAVSSYTYTRETQYKEWSGTVAVIQAMQGKGSTFTSGNKSFQKDHFCLYFFNVVASFGHVNVIF